MARRESVHSALALTAQERVRPEFAVDSAGRAALREFAAAKAPAGSVERAEPEVPGVAALQAFCRAAKWQAD